MRKVDNIYRRVGGEKRVRKCGKRGRSLRWYSGCRIRQSERAPHEVGGATKYGQTQRWTFMRV